MFFVDDGSIEQASNQTMSLERHLRMDSFRRKGIPKNRQKIQYSTNLIVTKTI
jgi:hypothetical protein